MKTTNEIVARIDALEKNGDDFFGFISGDLIDALPFNEASVHLKPEVTSEEWEASGARLRNDEDVINVLTKYMPFAWEKANDCRGLSASRSINHMQAWLWLLGHDKAAEEIEEYEFYGKPQLRAISEFFGIDWKALDDGYWRNGEEDDGIPPPNETIALTINP